MELIINEFNEIKSNNGLNQFLEKYKIGSDDKKNDGASGRSEYNYIGKYKEFTLTIQHTWWDRSKTFEPKPDGNSVVITIHDSQGKLIRTARVNYDED